MADSDIWADWLLRGRDGGDPEMRRKIVENLRPIRDRVIDGAQLQGGATVLDVGCGDGLIAFGVLEQFPDASVIFADISEPLLQVCAEIARAAGVETRCSFVQCSAADLSPLASESVDAVTLRSVLIYVDDRAVAHREFFRVLKPGGRLSYFEPTSAYGPTTQADEAFWGYPVGPVAHLTRKVNAIFEALQPPADSMRTFVDRDMLELAEQAGFDPVDLTIEVTAAHSMPSRFRHSWDQWLDQSGNPRIPSIREAVGQALSATEQEEFESHFRPLVERGAGLFRNGLMFLQASKPESPASASA